MSRIVKAILSFNLIVITVLVFVYPQLTVGPGKLIPGHRALEADCFACHSPLTGASSGLCINCHAPDKIGRVKVNGEIISDPLTSTPFHQSLVNLDCIACHRDHAGVKRFRPQGNFKHELLNTVALEQCQNCHKSPTDSLHQQLAGGCKQCHSQDKWIPATFDHTKFFELDRKHRTQCVTCHVRNDYSRYTCYGCHEHRPEKIRREHIKEGIRSFENCVECHRNANEHDIRGAHGKNQGKHKKNKDDDD